MSARNQTSPLRERAEEERRAHGPLRPARVVGRRHGGRHLAAGRDLCERSSRQLEGEGRGRRDGRHGCWSYGSRVRGRTGSGRGRGQGERATDGGAPLFGDRPPVLGLIMTPARTTLPLALVDRRHWLAPVALSLGRCVRPQRVKQQSRSTSRDGSSERESVQSAQAVQGQRVNVVPPVTPRCTAHAYPRRPTHAASARPPGPTRGAR